METLHLREFHQALGGRFTEVQGMEAVCDYGDSQAEYVALTRTAGVLDLSFRSRLCLTGADRVRFLHGQVTNDVKNLRTGQGCYAALVTAKGRMQSDINIYALENELLLDFEPGLARAVAERLERYIVADDVQVTDVQPLYGLLSVQGPDAEKAVRHLGLFRDIPGKPLDFVNAVDETLGELYLAAQARLGTAGFDIFVPLAGFGAVADKLVAAAGSLGGRACGWNALETARIEAGLPRFGLDMDEHSFPQECGIEARAVSYTKGCYIGQEVLNRIHTMGHVNRELRGLVLADEPNVTPKQGDRLFDEDREVGSITSAIASPKLKHTIALACVRRESGEIGRTLTLRTGQGQTTAKIVSLPFQER